MKQITLLILFLLSHALVIGQQKFFIKDRVTLEGIPFAKVMSTSIAPQLTDIDGAFQIPDSIIAGSYITVRSYGYLDTLIALRMVENFTIYLEPIMQEVEEVVVRAGENPAHRIIQAAIDNRKSNDPLRNNAFQYESYSKFVFDVDREALDSLVPDDSDSSMMSIMAFFDQQHLFLLESASRRTFIPPSKDKEEIIAYKVSGFQNPIFSTFANEIQSFSFYNESIQILGKEYVNPIAPGGTRRYLFILEDTLVINSDTTYTIFYRPRKGSNYDGLTGRLYINTDGFAIEKVTASPYDQSGFEVQIVQEYAHLNDKKWFPLKLSTNVAFPETISVNGLKMVGKGNTYIRNVIVDPEDLKKIKFNNVTVTTTEDAGETDQKTWENLREYKITERELKTYEVVDSISKAEKLEQKFDLLSSAMQGKIPLGKKINLDIAQVLNYDQYEGFRLGAGLKSSKRLIRHVTFGGYGAYGFKDKGFKYGGFSIIHISKKSGVDLKLSYSEDVAERGGLNFSNDGFNLTSPSLMRHFFIQKMDKQRIAEASLTWNVRANIRLKAFGNYQRVQQTGEYIYFSADGNLEQFDQAEIGGEITWNIREKVMMLGDTRVSKGTKWPKVQLKVVNGFTGFEASQFSYLRTSLSIRQDIRIRAFGTLTMVFQGDNLQGDVPLLYAYRGNGTGLSWNLSVPETFETMEPSRFYQTQQVALYSRLNIQSFKTKAKWNEPSISLHQAIGYGEYVGKERHSYAFESMDKGYFESGLILNGVLVSGFAQVGAGVFYRYGSYANNNWKNNIMPKFSIGVML